MRRNRPSRFASWRALCAALALLFGAVASPVALAGNSSGDVCAMACCVEQGHCCCKPTHAFVEGQTPDGKPRIAGTEIAVPCPEDCATRSTASPVFTRQALRPVAARLARRAAPPTYSPQSASPALATVSAATAPRAPPAGHPRLAN
jgi:hypothetical protein